MIYGEDYFYADSVLEQISKQSNGPVMHMRADGPNSATAEELVDIWDFYIGKVPNKILAALQSKGEVYCYFKTQQEATFAFQDWFPQKKQLLEEEMKYYIYAEMVNVAEGVYSINE